MIAGLPCLHMTSNKNFATQSADLSLMAAAFGHFVKKSVHVMIYAFSFIVLGNGPMRSIPTR